MAGKEKVFHNTLTKAGGKEGKNRRKTESEPKKRKKPARQRRADGCPAGRPGERGR